MNLETRNQVFSSLKSCCRSILTAIVLCTASILPINAASANPVFIEIDDLGPMPNFGLGTAIGYGGVSMNARGEVAYAKNAVPVANPLQVASSVILRHPGTVNGLPSLLYYGANRFDLGCYVPPELAGLAASRVFCEGIGTVAISDSGDVAFGAGNRLAGTGLLTYTDVLLGDGTGGPSSILKWAQTASGGEYNFRDITNTWHINNDGYIVANMLGFCDSDHSSFTRTSFILGGPGISGGGILGDPGSSPPGISLFDSCNINEAPVGGPSAVALSPTGSRVVFPGTLSSMSPAIEGLFVVDPVAMPQLPLTQIADLRVSTGATNSKINAQGLVAYSASVLDANDVAFSGLWVTDSNNPDPDITMHEQVAPAIITSYVQLLGINSSGQIAFVGTIGADFGLYIADRSTTPASVTPILLRDDPYPFDNNATVFSIVLPNMGFNDKGDIAATLLIDTDPTPAFNLEQRVIKIQTASGLEAIVGLPSIGGGPAPDLAVTVPGSGRVSLVDASTSAVFRNLNFGADPLVDLDVVPDVNGGGNPEVAVLQQRASGQVRVQLRDTGDSSLVRNLWYGNTHRPISMALFSDFNNDNALGTRELGVLGVNASDAVRTRIVDTGDGQVVSNVYFGSNGIAHDVVRIGEYSGNGIPEAGVLRTIRSTGQITMQVRDAQSAAYQNNVAFGNVYEPLRVISIPDVSGNNIDEVVMLGVDPLTQTVRVQTKDSSSNTPLHNIWMGNTNRAIDIALINDVNGNGRRELAVLLERPDGSGSARIYDSGDGTFIKNIFFRISNPQDLAVLADFSGNGSDELAALGTYDGVRRIAIRDTSDGAPLNRIDLP